MVIVGDLQPDQQTGIATPTLHPCGICRQAFLEPKSPIRPDTLVVTANPRLMSFEWFSVEALIKFHNSEGRDGSRGLARFASRPVSFDPVEPNPRTGAIDLSILNTPNRIKSDREVAERLTLPLLSYLKTLHGQ